MSSSGLICKITNIQGGKVTLDINGQKIDIDIEYLPLDSKIGDEFRLFFLDRNEHSLKEKKLARSILEEILNGK